MNQTELYAKMQEAWLAATGLRVSGYVRVIRTAASNEFGWNNGWSEHMNPSVGKLMKVTAIDPTDGLLLDDSYQYPYFVLEPASVLTTATRIKAAHLTLQHDDIDVVIANNQVTAGCQTVPLDAFEQFVNKARDLQHFITSHSSLGTVFIVLEGTVINKVDLDHMREAIVDYKTHTK